MATEVKSRRKVWFNDSTLAFSPSTCDHCCVYGRLGGGTLEVYGMTKRKHVSPEALDASLVPKQRKPIPHAFVLDAISTLSPYTRPMFGCLAIYVRDKIVLILRDKATNTADNGVWLATTQEHHQSLRPNRKCGLNSRSSSRLAIRSFVISACGRILPFSKSKGGCPGLATEAISAKTPAAPMTSRRTAWLMR